MHTCIAVGDNHPAPGEFTSCLVRRWATWFCDAVMGGVRIKLWSVHFYHCLPVMLRHVVTRQEPATPLWHGISQWCCNQDQNLGYLGHSKKHNPLFHQAYLELAVPLWHGQSQWCRDQDPNLATVRSSTYSSSTHTYFDFITLSLNRRRNEDSLGW